MFILVCRNDNDLYRVLSANGWPVTRAGDLAEALRTAPEGSAVLSLADDYPCPGVAIDQAALDLCVARRLKLFAEFPSALPGYEISPPQPTQWERVVVASDFFAPALATRTILALPRERRTTRPTCGRPSCGPMRLRVIRASSTAPRTPST